MSRPDRDLARRVEEGCAKVAARQARELGRIRPGTAAASEAIGGGFAIYTGVGSPLTIAAGLGLAGEVREQDLDRLEAFFRARGVASQIDLCPLAHPSLLELLARRGYRLGAFQQTMVRDPREPLAREPRPAGLEVRLVGPEENALWVRTASQAYFEPGPIPPAVLGLYESMSALPDAALFLAFVEGRVAGAAAACRIERLGILFAAGTLQPFRGRGVHRTHLAVRLAHLKEAGCDLAVLGAAPGSISERNAARLGFQIVYTRARMVLDDRGGSEMLLHY